MDQIRRFGVLESEYGQLSECCEQMSRYGHGRALHFKSGGSDVIIMLLLHSVYRVHSGATSFSVVNSLWRGCYGQDQSSVFDNSLILHTISTA